MYTYIYIYIYIYIIYLWDLQTPKWRADVPGNCAGTSGKRESSLRSHPGDAVQLAIACAIQGYSSFQGNGKQNETSFCIFLRTLVRMPLSQTVSVLGTSAPHSHRLPVLLRAEIQDMCGEGTICMSVIWQLNWEGKLNHICLSQNCRV